MQLKATNKCSEIKRGILLSTETINHQINQGATIKKAKQFLKEYDSWHLTTLRLRPASQIRVLSPVEEKQLAKASFECQVRQKTLDVMRETDDVSSLLADLLRWRYLCHWTVPKSCQQLADKYQLGYLSERTYMRYQNHAILNFAILFPIDLLIQKN